MEIFLIPEYYNTMNLDRPSNEDILFYMYRAYRDCYFSDISPMLFEFYDSLIDQVHLSDRNAFSFRGALISKCELNNPYFIEFLLKDYHFQYFGNDDKEHCDCQNILLQEMIEYDG